MVGDAQLATVETMENEAMDTGYSENSGSDYEWTRMVARQCQLHAVVPCGAAAIERDVCAATWTALKFAIERRNMSE